MGGEYQKQKFAQILTSQTWSDCSFIINGEKIMAHKLILACSSPVFENMFYGKMANAEVEIKDANKEDFKIMLQYIYTNQVEINTVQQAWNLVYLCEKYFLLDLIYRCEEYIKQHLSIDSMALCYEYANLYGFKELKERCLKDSVPFLKEVLLMSQYHMKAETIDSILNYCNDQSNYIPLGIVNWAICECLNENVEETVSNIYSVIEKNDLLKHMQKIHYKKIENFGNLDTDDLEKLKNISKIAEKLYESYIAVSCPPRRPPMFQRPICFRGHFKIIENDRFRRLAVFSTMFKVEKDCFLSAVAVSTLHMPADAKTNRYEGEIGIKIEVGDEVQFKEETSGFFEYDSNFTMNISQFVLLRKHVEHRVAVRYLVPNDGEILVRSYWDHPHSGNSSLLKFGKNNDVVYGLCFYPL